MPKMTESNALLKSLDLEGDYFHWARHLRVAKKIYSKLPRSVQFLQNSLFSTFLCTSAFILVFYPYFCPKI